MKANPILEEAWRAKGELAREADFDLHRLCENTRQWAAQHPRTGPACAAPRNSANSWPRRNGNARKARHCS